MANVEQTVYVVQKKEGVFRQKKKSGKRDPMSYGLAGRLKWISTLDGQTPCSKFNSMLAAIGSCGTYEA